MEYRSKNRCVNYLVLGLSVFLLFCLLFESYIELPRLVSWLGRWHPLVLHFPIVFLLISIFLSLTGKKVSTTLLNIAVVSALITAISGFFLGKDTLIKGDLLLWHQWLGGSVALLSALWYALSILQLGQSNFTKIIQVVLIGGIYFTGHYGGMITHGEDFLALPIEKRNKKIPDNPVIYSDVVTRILDDKCVTCHNPNKKKGQLLMTSFDALLKGGESGNILVPGDPENSQLIQRLHLPADDEEHMPPEGKTPLNENEISILEQWIALGASDTLRLEQLNKSEPLVSLIKGLMEPNAMEKWAKLPKVADSTLQILASDYLTIKRMASNSNALSVDFYLPPEYDSKPITDLQRVASNIIELDLSGIPIGEEEIAFIATCSNLEWLEIDKTPISDTEVEKLVNLKNLSFLKIYETSITDNSVPIFKRLPSLNRLYLWKTSITENSLSDLQKARPSLLVNDGIDEKTNAFFVAKDTITKTKNSNQLE